MNSSIHSIIEGCLIMLVLFGCENEKNSNKGQILSGKLINSSSCKGLKSADALTGTPDTLSCIEYAYNATDNKLLIKHINAGFNCCPDSIHGDIVLAGDTIVISELEENGLCNCNCLYDLDFEISGVVAREYRIKIIEPYKGDQENIEFDMDLLKIRDGSYCVTRKQYPWGISAGF